MKFCPNCRTTFDDSVINCPQCGTPLMSVPNAAPENITDHTAEFDPTDISDNKVLAMIPYLLGVMGVIITLLASGKSPYAFFHVKQALKIYVIFAISLVLAIIPFIGWFVIGIWMIITYVLNIICFIKVCQNKAEEPPIISSFKFLK